MNKNNRPTAAHRAPFYPAIDRSLGLPPVLEHATARQRSKSCKGVVVGSWCGPKAATHHEQSLRQRNDGRDIAHDGCGRGIIRHALARHGSDGRLAA